MAAASALYFTLSFEPNIIYPIVAFLIAILFLLFRQTRIAGLFIALFVGGFLYADIYTRMVNTPQITHDMRNTEITGTVANIDYTDTKSRMFIKIPSNQINKDLSANKTAMIRVSFDQSLVTPKIGDAISARVTLYRPDGPVAPGAFDYARWAYFNGISATGYVTELKIKNINRQSVNINSLRDTIHNHTNSFLSDTLVLGYKNAVPRDDVPVWTASGVGHVWSISGFHMTLVGGWLAILFYAVFRLIAPITRRIPARYPALVCAWFGLLFYLFLSGIDVATIRAFLMTTLIFAAFLFGRVSLSLRNVCMVFFAIYLLNPHYVIQPGFQLSFAAIFGLVWWFGDMEYKKRNLVGKFINITKITAQTSIIATIFTAPFVAHHFYFVPLYGLIGNLILLPVFSIAIMPLVIIGTITALFGWTGPLILSDRIYYFLLGIANHIASLPGAQLQIPHISGTALGLVTIGFLCLMFINNIGKLKINYVLCGTFMTAGVLVVLLTPRPIFYSTDDNKLIGVVKSGTLEFNQARASDHYFAFESWKKLNFENPTTDNKRFKCDHGVCRIKTKNWNLVYVQKYMPLARNIVDVCRDDNVDFIVSYFHVTAPKCRAKIMRGGFVIYEPGRIKYTPSGRWWNH